jgi:Fic family protein
MDAGDFGNDAPGRLVRCPEGHIAYIPNPLPPTFSWTAEIAQAQSNADFMLGRLAGVAQTLPNPQLVIGPFVRREAVLSSRIEGTQASLSDVVLFEVAPGAGSPFEDVREVANYLHALEYARSRIREVPLSLRLIRETHAKLLEDVRGADRQPGEFRQVQNWIGTPGTRPAEARFVPPPPGELPHCLDEFERYLHAPSTLPPLVRLALIHYQFEAIHPFTDGNGRIGRLLVTLLLCAAGIVPQPLLYLSAYFDQHRRAYYDHLLAVSRAGAWEGWLLYFLRGVSEQAADGVERANRLLALREKFRDECQTARCPATTLKLVDELFRSPAVTLAKTGELLGVTPRAAQMNIDKLVTLGILREVTGQQRNRAYLADEIVRVVEPAEAPASVAATAEPERVGT